MEFFLVRPEKRHVVYVPDIMTDAEALPYEMVERLEDGVREPLGDIKADFDTVLDDPPHEIKKNRVFNFSPEETHNLARR